MDLDDSFCTHTSTERQTETKVEGTEHVFAGNDERGFGEVKVHEHYRWRLPPNRAFISNGAAGQYQHF